MMTDDEHSIPINVSLASGRQLYIVGPDGTRYHSLEEAEMASGISSMTLSYLCMHEDHNGWSFHIGVAND